MTKNPSNDSKSGREKRLQQALRANLARRKIQARARRDADVDTGPGEPVPEAGGAGNEPPDEAASPLPRGDETGASTDGDER